MIANAATGLCKTYYCVHLSGTDFPNIGVILSRRFSGRVVVGNDFAAAPAQSPNKNRLYSPVLVKKSFCCSPLGSAVFSLENSQSFDAHRSSITAYSDDLYVIHVAARSATQSHRESSQQEASCRLVVLTVLTTIISGIVMA